jgi:hypothetical protein
MYPDKLLIFCIIFSVDTIMPMITTRKVDICVLLIYFMVDPKEQLTLMENGKLLSIYPMNIMPKDTEKDTRNTLKHKD